MLKLSESDILDFTASVNKYIDKFIQGTKSGSYNPYLAESYLQDINMSPQKVDNKNLANMLANPHKYAKSLRDFSQYLENNIMQYMRTLDYFASIPTYLYELIPLDNATYIKSKGVWEEFQNSKRKVTKYLQKFQPKKAFHAISDNIIRHGVVFYYYKETADSVMLVELPRDYCTITGKNEYGWEFGINLTFFDKYVGLENSIPELYEQYKVFCIMREAKSPEASKYVFYRMPMELGWCFSFDENKPDQSPPFKQLFKDTLAIVDYKDLLRTKVMLDTVMMLIQKIPFDKDTKRPMMSRPEAEQYVGMTQSNLPVGVKTTATPLDCELVNFSSAQTQNNIIGLGEANFFNSAGVSEILFGGDTKSALSLAYSTKVDFGFVEHLYNQYMNFLNYRLSLVSRKYRWEVLMYGNRYEDEEKLKTTKELVQSLNFPMSAIASYRYEPWQYENLIALENELKTKENTTPIVSGTQASAQTLEDNKGGRPEGVSTDSGEITKEHDSNANAMK